MAWLGRKGESSSSNDRAAEVFSRRLNALLAAENGLETEDPDEVEARIRNITHGTGRAG